MYVCSWRQELSALPEALSQKSSRAVPVQPASGLQSAKQAPGGYAPELRAAVGCGAERWAQRVPQRSCCKFWPECVQKALIAPAVRTPRQADGPLVLLAVQKPGQC